VYSDGLIERPIVLVDVNIEKLRRSWRSQPVEAIELARRSVKTSAGVR
jgi:hypothetical protein